MFEVLPNWHPLFVHFVVALLSMSTLFFVSLKILATHKLHGHLKVMAYWNLWLGTGFAVITVIAGWFAYNSVAHDTPSHAAMTDHRNWALVTLSVYTLITFWSFKSYKKVKDTSMTFTIVIILASALLVSTGWRGSEAVYRYGLGVMSLPKSEGDGHAHEHSEGDKSSSSKNHQDAVAEHDVIENKPHQDTLDPHLVKPKQATVNDHNADGINIKNKQHSFYLLSILGVS